VDLITTFDLTIFIFLSIELGLVVLKEKQT